MRKIDALELKQIQLNIMDTISNFCEQNNIKYWLHFGSLLGAIRHKGYIPWDDDIDIGMLREDYNKFAENFNSYNEQYQLHDLNNDTEYNLLFGKVFDIKTFAKDSNMSEPSCVNVDIFVFDEISDKENKQKKMFKRRNFYRMMNNQQMLPIRFSKNILKNLLKIIIKFILNFVPRNWFVKRYTKILKRSFEYSNYVGNFLGYTDDVFSKKLVEDTYKVDFEDRQYRIPAGYDEILRICYGNYMELPPVDQRGGGHVGIEVYSIT